jgi:hypothetical protein
MHDFSLIRTEKKIKNISEVRFKLVLGPPFKILILDSEFWNLFLPLQSNFWKNYVCNCKHCWTTVQSG